MRRIGILYAGAAEDNEEREARSAAFRNGLAKLGWIEGRNLAMVVVRIDLDRLRASTAELASQSLEAILVVGNPALAAMRRAAPATPIVFVQVGDPVGSGFVTSLARPGGNTTGFMHYEPAMGGKWLQTLKEAAPAITRALVLFHPDVAANDGFLRAAETAGPALKVAVEGAGVRNADEFARAIASFARVPGGGVVALPNPVTSGNRKALAELGIEHKLPTIGAFRYIVANGALISYGIDPVAIYQSAATYVDRILRGEKPANLPVRAPTKYEMAINLKTAKALGIEVPPMLLARADEVIE